MLPRHQWQLALDADRHRQQATHAQSFAGFRHHGVRNDPMQVHVEAGTVPARIERRENGRLVEQWIRLCDEVVEPLAADATGAVDDAARDACGAARAHCARRRSPQGGREQSGLHYERPPWLVDSAARVI